MLFEKPNCDGDEDSLFNCRGANAMGIKVDIISVVCHCIYTYIYIYNILFSAMFACSTTCSRYT